MKRTGLTVELTAGLTDLPPSTLALVVNPGRRCARCGRRLIGRQMRFCSGSCRTLDNADKWAQAPGAVLTWLTGLTLRGVIEAHPTLAQLELALEAAGAKRWAKLMQLIGLEWHSEERRWKTND